MRKLLVLGLGLVLAAGMISCQTTQSSVNTDTKSCPLQKMGVACKSDGGRPCPIRQGKGPCNDCVQEAEKLRNHQETCKGHDGKPCPAMANAGGCAKCPNSAGQANPDMMAMMKKQQSLMAEFEKMNQEATDLLSGKEYKKAIAILKSIEDKFQPNQMVSYNLACAYSLSGDAKSALAELRKSIQYGWDDWKHMDTDTDLDNIRNDAEYKKLRSALESIYPELPDMNEGGCGSCPINCK